MLGKQEQCSQHPLPEGSKSTNTAKPSREPREGHKYHEESKHLSSPHTWRLWRLFDLLYLLPSTPSPHFSASFRHRYVRGEVEAGSREPSWLSAASFLVFPSLSFALTDALCLFSPTSLSSMPSLLSIKTRFNVFPSLSSSRVNCGEPAGCSGGTRCFICAIKGENSVNNIIFNKILGFGRPAAFVSVLI